MIYETVRSRIDTALNRGRCGLWDWDLARGRIFWSHSMFAILGLDPRDELMTFGEVSKLVHPDDIKLYQVAAELADAKTSAIDHEFRMMHADGTLGLAARALRAGAAGRTSRRPASDRHRRRYHRTEVAGGKDRRRRHAPARRDRDHPRGVRSVGRRQPAGAVQFQFPDPAQSAGPAIAKPAPVTKPWSPPAASTSSAPRAPAKIRWSGRPHLRGAARRRPLAADQRAAHQGRRLCLGRHRHHRAQAQRNQAGGQRAAPDGDHRRSAQLAAQAGIRRPSSSPTSRANMPRRRTAPKRPTRPSPNSWPT